MRPFLRISIKMGAAEGYLQGIDDYTVIKICTIGEKSVLIDSLISVSLEL